MLEIIKGGATSASRNKCVVTFEGTTEGFTEFIVVGFNKVTTEVVLRQHADALTMGKALQMIATQFAQVRQSMSPSELKELDSILQGGAN